MNAQRSIGLYVHIPFCQYKCAYCDFYSVVTLDAMDRFVDALCREIELRAALHAAEVEVSTMFWGGGTPSLLAPAHVERIARVLGDCFKWSPDLEWTLEANPGTITLDKLWHYRQLGVNRLSFGVQSFDAKELLFLERIHSAAQAEEAVELARRAGFENINIDIMYALPGQDIRTHERNLERACMLDPEHISAYSLVYEPGTPLYHRMQRGLVVPLGEEQEAALYLTTSAILEAHGYRQYEVSNFAKEGRQCRHNLLYWRRGEYLGFGPSAHSHWNNVRWSNRRSIQHYLDALSCGEFPLAQQEHLSLQQQCTEHVFLSLRAEGLDLAAFEQLYQVRLTVGEPRRVLDEWIAAGWARIEHGRLRLTTAGYALCDEMAVELLDAIDRARCGVPDRAIL
jgi:oxygen-independent coproporphyrinogen-3 oxidase